MKGSENVPSSSIIVTFSFVSSSVVDPQWTSTLSDSSASSLSTASCHSAT